MSNSRGGGRTERPSFLQLVYSRTVAVTLQQHAAADVTSQKKRTLTSLCAVCAAARSKFTCPAPRADTQVSLHSVTPLSSCPGVWQLGGPRTYREDEGTVLRHCYITRDRTKTRSIWEVLPSQAPESTSSPNSQNSSLLTVPSIQRWSWNNNKTPGSDNLPEDFFTAQEIIPTWCHQTTQRAHYKTQNTHITVALHIIYIHKPAPLAFNFIYLNICILFHYYLSILLYIVFYF